MKLMPELDLAYLAGLFDGEGCVAISQKKNKVGVSYGLFISITNTDLEVLQWILRSTGIGKVTAKPRQEKWKLCYHWLLVTHEIKDFLLALRPYLRIKKRRAEIMLEFLETQKYRGPHHRISMEDSVLREILFEELGELNKRGG